MCSGFVGCFVEVIHDVSRTRSAGESWWRMLGFLESLELLVVCLFFRLGCPEEKQAGLMICFYAPFP
jgi:hypothetical protein